MCRPAAPAPTYTAAYREACEVKSVLSHRGEWLHEFWSVATRVRGAEACQRLRTLVNEELDRRSAVLSAEAAAVAARFGVHS